MARRRKLKTSSCHYFPPELCAEVLLRLPARALLKFRCVCKSWRSLIDSPNFASDHLIHYKQNAEAHQILLLEVEDRNFKSQRWLVRDSVTFRANMSLFPIFVDSWVGGYVNGLLLLCSFAYGIVLWNPSLGQWLRLRGLASCSCRQMDFVETGLGFDQSSNDYKVVAFVYPFTDSESVLSSRRCSKRPPRFHRDRAVFVEVYSLRSRSWRRIRDGAPYFYCKGPSVFLGVAIHWIGFDMKVAAGKWRKDHQILSFNVTSEVFDYIQLPHCDHDIEPAETSLVVFDGCLTLLDSFLGHCSIWVMEEYGAVESWTRRYVIDFGFVTTLLHLSGNGELLFVGENGGVKSYHVDNQQIKDVTKAQPRYVLFAATYMDSLVRFKGENVQHVVNVPNRDSKRSRWACSREYSSFEVLNFEPL
ncbi:hypothetical protein Dimus_014356 [Dionaea muscipula]